MTTITGTVIQNGVCYTAKKIIKNGAEINIPSGGGGGPKNGCIDILIVGGGGNASRCGASVSKGAGGLVIVAYKTDGSCGILPTSSGGCKFTCGTYTMHCFTSCSDSFNPVFK